MKKENGIICGTLAGVLVGLISYHFLGDRSARKAIADTVETLNNKAEDGMENLKDKAEDLKDKTKNFFS